MSINTTKRTLDFRLLDIYRKGILVVEVPFGRSSSVSFGVVASEAWTIELTGRKDRASAAGRDITEAACASSQRGLKPLKHIPGPPRESLLTDNITSIQVYLGTRRLRIRFSSTRVSSWFKRAVFAAES